MLAEIHRDAKKRPEPFTAEDFMLRPPPRELEEEAALNPEEIDDVWDSFFGGIAQ